MQRLGQLVRGVFGNWMAMAAGILIGFFLSPFVVAKLGNSSYGVWTLVVSIASYMGLLDFGLRGAVVRFVSRGHARGEHELSSKAVSAALAVRLVIAAVILLVSVALSLAAPHVLKIPPELVRAARLAILITALNVSVSLTLGVFGGVLVALRRFDLTSTVQILQVATRAVGVVLLLRSGYGIVALALWELFAVVLANLLLAVICLRQYSELRVNLRAPDTGILRDLWGYSSWLFLTHVGQQVIFYTDNLLVGATISAAAVTFYAIGASLVEYMRGVVSSLSATFTPLASSFEATGEQENLRRLLIKGTQATALVALPIELALLFRGETFIALWMGPEYAAVSGAVLRVLVVSQIVLNLSHTAGGIMYGVARHKRGAIWTGGEAIANLTLSLILIRYLGLVGVAWGTLIPAAFVALFLRPRYACSLVGVRVRDFLVQGGVRPLVAAIPYAAACYWTNLHWTAPNLGIFFLQIAATLPLFVVGVLLVFRNDAMELWRKRRAGVSRAASAAATD